MDHPPFVTICLALSAFALFFVRLHMTPSKRADSEIEKWKKFHRRGDSISIPKPKGLDSAHVAKVLRLPKR